MDKLVLLIFLTTQFTLLQSQVFSSSLIASAHQASESKIIEYIPRVTSIVNDDGTYSKGPVNAKNERIGYWEKYYPNGRLFMTQNYLNGILNGSLTSYYKNGRKLSECYYVQGKLNGLTKQYSIQGDLIREVNYRDNIIHGFVRQYEDGLIATYDQYEEGSKHGKSIQYSKGLPIKQCEYTYGELKWGSCKKL